MSTIESNNVKGEVISTPIHKHASQETGNNIPDDILIAKEPIKEDMNVLQEYYKGERFYIVH